MGLYVCKHPRRVPFCSSMSFAGDSIRKENALLATARVSLAAWSLRRMRVQPHRVDRAAVPGVWARDMRRPPSRIWRILKWSGSAACALIAVLWFGSLWFAVWYAEVSRGLVVGIGSGGLVVVAGVSVSEDGWHCRPVRETSFSESVLWWHWAGRPLGGFGRAYPLWPPLLVLAVPTAVLWWRDRRYLKGCCQSCGYDLTGNVSGRCPECGMATDRSGLLRR